MSKRKKPTPPIQWDTLAADKRLAGEYSALATALQQAQSLAVQKSVRMGGDPSEYMDLSRAFQIIDRSPELLPYLTGVAKESSAVPGSFLLKNSPTGNATPQQSAQSGSWSGQKDTTDTVVNARILRDWADSNEWVRAAINVRRQQIGRASIAVLPANERKTYNKQLAKKVQLILDQPNELRQNYYDLMAACVDDILVLDRGVIVKDMTAARQPVHLYNEDGANVKIYSSWSGKPNEPRYLYEDPNNSRKVPLRNDEAIVMTANPATYRFSLSPVQVLRNTIQADLAATRSAMQMVDMKPPPHMIQLPGATQSQLEQIRMKYETEIAGRKEIFWLGGQNNANVVPLIFSAKDNQWLEWQQYLAKKIAVSFQISPQQLGMTFDINKSTASSQQEIFEDTGLIPLLLLVEEYFNREILGDFATNFPDGRANFDLLNLRILFPEVTEADRQMHAEKAISIATTGLAGLPSMTLNQVLALFGEEGVEGGNTFYSQSAQGPVPWLSYDNEIGEFVSPYATGGMPGSQDALSGPSENAVPRDGSGGQGDYAGPTPTGDEGDPPPAVDASSTDDNTTDDKKPKKPAVKPKKPAKSINRPFGKRWRPNQEGY